MSDNTAITWTDATWNPVTGCTKVSPGCAHCYAETFAERFRGVAGHYFERGFDVQLRPDKLDVPLHWKRPRRIFVNSMSDLFHEDVPDEFIDRVFAVMALTPWHTYQVLTKRPQRMLVYCAALTMERVIDRCNESADGGEHRLGAYNLSSIAHKTFRARQRSGERDPYRLADLPLPNVQLGVSVENQRMADERIPLLLQTPAAVRFISAEPLLGPVAIAEDLRWHNEWWEECDACDEGEVVTCIDDLCANTDTCIHGDGYGPCERCGGKGAHYSPERPGLDWVIVGGESGPKHREMNLVWARSLRDQCRAAGVPFFFKQAAGRCPGMPSGDPSLDGCKEMPK